MDEEWKKTLTTEKFSPLKPYFESIETKDLPDFTVDEFISFAKPKHKALMKLFIIRSIDKFLDLHNPFPLPKPSQQEQQKSGIFDYHSQLAPKVFANSAYLQGKATVADIIKSISNGAVEVDLSNNNLTDEDVPAIVLLTETCTPKTVNISSNRIHGVADTQNMTEEAIMKILEVVQFLNITWNPFASTDKKDFFARLKQQQLERLVWIPEAWVSAGHWKALIPRITTPCSIPRP